MNARPIGADGRGRGPGRPRAVNRGSSVSTWLPESVHDQLIAMANRQEVSVSKLVADAVKRQCFDPLFRVEGE